MRDMVVLPSRALPGTTWDELVAELSRISDELMLTSLPAEVLTSEQAGNKCRCSVAGCGHDAGNCPNDAESGKQRCDACETHRTPSK